MLNTSVSLDDTAWEYTFNTPAFPSPAPRPSLLARQTPGSSASFHPHTRSRGPVVGGAFQTPPDIRLARWRRIDRKVSQQRRRSEVFTRNRANSDTSWLYSLGTGEENLSFGELRTFDDSYNLAEPEPVLDPVILNFVPVPAVEADMAGANENVEAILQANPPLVPEAPDPGAQNINRGGNNDQAEPPPRGPPHIKLDPNLPGVNLNMTVAEWVMLQEQYNADHAQRNDEEEDIAQ